VSRFFVILFLVVSFIGFLDAGYLVANHYFGAPLTCIVTDGCETVTTSSYSRIMGIPVALLGALYYLTVFLLTVAFLDTKRRLFFDCARLLTLAGFLFSLWFLFVQAFVLRSYCIYCLGSIATSTILFLAAIISFFQKETPSRERLKDVAA
jgi:uncharacterized membrane protein